MFKRLFFFSCLLKFTHCSITGRPCFTFHFLNYDEIFYEYPIRDAFSKCFKLRGLVFIEGPPPPWEIRCCARDHLEVRESATPYNVVDDMFFF